MGVIRTVARVAVVLLVVGIVLAAGWAVFVEYPTSLTDLFGVILVVLLAFTAVRVGGNAAQALFPGYNVAEVAVEGPISRDSGGGLGSAPVGASADDIVEQIERADADRGADALLVKLNTPGGEIVPSQDIRLAAERFDGPTLAYATDVCASGGYEIASGCDELWAREGSIVGSIGVIGSRVNAAELADRLGVEYEQLTAGEYKDAGTPLKELEDDEREYLQGLIDDYYDQFVAGVAEGRDIDAETIRDTEARVYLGQNAQDLGLVDELGTREAVEDRLADHLSTDPVIEEFEPQRGIARRLQGGTQRLSYAFGAGIADRFTGGETGLRFR
jgi:protease-4